MSPDFIKALPKITKPQLATLTNKTPSGKQWIHEIKFDGYRMLCFIRPQSIQFITRNGNDWSDKFPELIEQIKSFPKVNTILDGEVVVLDKRGLSKFQLLQNSFDRDNTESVIYFVFDILYYNGKNQTNLPLIDRKRILSTVFKSWKRSHRNIILTEFIDGYGTTVFKEACRQGLEGIISKDITSLYEQKRTKSWLKSKCIHRQEFVIGGFTKPQGSRKYFGALLLGYYDKNKLIYSGKVGTGFSEKTLAELYTRMQRILSKKSPFFNSEKIPRQSQIYWVKPKLAAELVFTEWTSDGSLRHPSYMGLRLDKNIKEITKE